MSPRLPAEDVDRFGFRWGPLDVIRIAGDYRGRMVEVKTAHRAITVWVSAGGRSLRVYSVDGAELLAKPRLNPRKRGRK